MYIYSDLHKAWGTVYVFIEHAYAFQMTSKRKHGPYLSNCARVLQAQGVTHLMKDRVWAHAVRSLYMIRVE
jgi:hypothetical protein